MHIVIGVMGVYRNASFIGHLVANFRGFRAVAVTR